MLIVKRSFKEIERDLTMLKAIISTTNRLENERDQKITEKETK